MRVEIYSKANCSSCEGARALVERAQARWHFELSSVDIWGDEDLKARYRYKVPVVVIDGVEALSLQFSEHELEQALQGRSGT